LHGLGRGDKMQLPMASHFIIIPLRVADDVPLARYAVQASHAAAGAAIVLDLSDVQAGEDVDLDGLINEFARTAEGNSQRLAVVGPRAAIEGDDVARTTFHGDLVACLQGLGPVARRSFEVQLTLPARLDYLAPVRSYVAEAIRSLHGDADGFQVEILVDELCLNAVENSPSGYNSYEVRIRCEGHELEIEVTNVFDGSINSERIMNRRLQSFDDSGDYLGERGRGLFLVARLADGLQIRALDAERIRVVVTKRLGQTDASAVGQRREPREETAGS